MIIWRIIKSVVCFVTKDWASKASSQLPVLQIWNWNLPTCLISWMTCNTCFMILIKLLCLNKMLCKLINTILSDVLSLCLQSGRFGDYLLPLFSGSFMSSLWTCPCVCVQHCHPVKYADLQKNIGPLDRFWSDGESFLQTSNYHQGPQDFEESF